MQEIKGTCRDSTPNQNKVLNMLADTIQYSVGWDSQNLSNHFLPQAFCTLVAFPKIRNQEMLIDEKYTSAFLEKTKKLERIRVPSGKLTWLAGISPFSIGNTSSNNPFSIAMLDYRSVI